MKLQAFDLSSFYGKSHFDYDDKQNYLVFQPVYRYFKKLLIAIIFQCGDQKDSVMKVLNLLLHLIKLFLQRQIILTLNHD